MSPGGTQLATSPPKSGQGNVCGTYAAGWTNATYPSVVGQSVSVFLVLPTTVTHVLDMFTGI
jgi:hypothetical protein